MGLYEGQERQVRIQLCGPRERASLGTLVLQYRGDMGPFPWCLSWGCQISLSLGHAVTGTSGKSRLWEGLGLLLMVGVNLALETIS